jgi:hypothetical protein
VTEEQRVALRSATAAFEVDRDARNEALAARHGLVKACVEAHTLGISDQQLANSFARLAKDKREAYSRARIQQLRTKENS